MSKKDTKKELLKDEETELNGETAAAETDPPEQEKESPIRGFSFEKIGSISSAEHLNTEESPATGAETLSAQPAIPADSIPAEEDILELEDPVFRELAEPKLPQLPKENRARLLMQSPTRLQFYWSIKQNPFQTLNRAFGGRTGSYTLVAKLINQKNDREEILPVEAEGSWWFNVDADAAYRAEIGFYAPNRPFIRVMFSNTLETPRKNPSPRRATEADWAVTAQEFAEVLDSTGYTQDAFEVALAGDDADYAETATHKAFGQFIGEQATESGDITAEEIRFALLAIVSGFSLADLRDHIGSTLFAMLEQNAEKLTVENALSALSEHFDISLEEIEEEEETIGEAVFGLSLIHFPRVSKKKRTSPKTLLPKGFQPGAQVPGGKVSPISSLRKVSPVSSF